MILVEVLTTRLESRVISWADDGVHVGHEKAPVGSGGRRYTFWKLRERDVAWGPYYSPAWLGRQRKPFELVLQFAIAFFGEFKCA